MSKKPFTQLRLHKALLEGDLKQITRDPIYVLMFAGPLLLAVFVRFGVPLLSEILGRYLPIILMDHYVFLTGLFAQIPSLLIGFFAGFVLLDDRDGGLLEYFSVTPLGRKGYLLYRLLIPCLMSVPVTMAYFFIAGYSGFILILLIPASISIGLQGALLVVFLGAFAANKVEGLAYGKGFGAILLAPVAGYLLPGNWGWAAGVLPPFWTVRSAMAAAQKEPVPVLLYSLAGFSMYCLYLFLLYRRFRKRVV